jgi:hypothetical protein
VGAELQGPEEKIGPRQEALRRDWKMMPWRSGDGGPDRTPHRVQLARLVLSIWRPEPGSRSSDNVELYIRDIM